MAGKIVGLSKLRPETQSRILRSYHNSTESGQAERGSDCIRLSRGGSNCIQTPFGEMLIKFVGIIDEWGKEWYNSSG